jgi:putative transposase
MPLGIIPHMQPGVRDWPHSSFHRDVRAGIFPEDWVGDIDAGGEFGER